MIRNYSTLKFLHECTPEQRKAILKIAKPDLIRAICDCVVCAFGDNSLTKEQIQSMAKKVNLKKMKELMKRKTTNGRRKKIIVQHGGGIFKALLGGVLNLLGSI